MQLNQQIKYFQKLKYPIITLDIRGHGQSEIPKKPIHLTINNTAKDIEQIIKKHQLKRIILIGYSLGGYIALQLTKKQPQIIEKLILLNSSGKCPNNIKKIKNMINKKIIKKTIIKYHKLLIKNKQKNKEIKTENSYAYFIKQALNATPETIYYFAQDITKQNIKKYNTITTPTLLIGHTKDQFFTKKEIEKLGKTLKNTITKIYKGDHKTVITNPQQIIQEIQQFIHTNQEYFKEKQS